VFHGSGALGFDAVPALAHLARVDRPLARIIEQVGEFRLRPGQLESPYEALGQAILHQQISGRAAAAIQTRLQALFESERFPAPERIAPSTPEVLRQAGLSRAKALALLDLAQRTLSGEVPTVDALHTQSDEALVESLTRIRGVGRWTVEMLLIFRLARPDVLPATDYGIRQGFAQVFRKKELPTPGEILRRGERWRPFRTVASWYLWRALEL